MQKIQHPAPKKMANPTKTQTRTLSFVESITVLTGAGVTTTGATLTTGEHGWILESHDTTIDCGIVSVRTTVFGLLESTRVLIVLYLMIKLYFIVSKTAVG